MGDDRAQRFGALILRVVSTVAGALILKHEVYDADSAEVVVIALGLWLIGVPPALWLDALRRASRTLDPDSGSERASDGKEPGDGDGPR